MPDFIHRTITQKIIEQKDKFPLLGLTGPRQSGKTTLLKTHFKDYEYVSLENPDVRAFAAEDPNGFLNKYHGYTILDEVQRVPELFSYLQTRVDESQKMGQYILSGSQNFHLLRNITQTLAGRIALFKLLPLDFHELKSAGSLASSYSAASVKGFYPAIFDRDIRSPVFYANYLQSYIEKDVSELVNIHNTHLFRTFLSLCAHNAGQLLNLSSLALAAGISHTTARAWLSILESSYLVFLLQPYHENFKKRVTKSPKLYFYDTGLLCHLLGLQKAGDMDENRLKGNIFENLIIAEYQKINYHHYLLRNYYFWRDSNQHEVDLLLKEPNGFSIFEIKATQTVKSSLFNQMNYFESLAATDKVHKTLIYGGNDNQLRTGYDVLSWYNING
jgi:predicted AAA+ superfamily ATPase